MSQLTELKFHFVAANGGHGSGLRPQRHGRCRRTAETAPSATSRYRGAPVLKTPCLAILFVCPRTCDLPATRPTILSPGVRSGPNLDLASEPFAAVISIAALARYRCVAHHNKAHLVAHNFVSYLLDKVTLYFAALRTGAKPPFASILHRRGVASLSISPNRTSPSLATIFSIIGISTAER